MGKMTDDGQTVDPIFRQTQILAIPQHKWMKIESNGSCAPANSLQNQASIGKQQNDAAVLENVRVRLESSWLAG